MKPTVSDTSSSRRSPSLTRRTSGSSVTNRGVGGEPPTPPPEVEERRLAGVRVPHQPTVGTEALCPPLAQLQPPVAGPPRCRGPASRSAGESAAVYLELVSPGPRVRCPAASRESQSLPPANRGSSTSAAPAPPAACLARVLARCARCPGYLGPGPGPCARAATRSAATARRQLVVEDHQVGAALVARRLQHGQLAAAEGTWPRRPLPLLEHAQHDTGARVAARPASSSSERSASTV